jgi:site-specific DNA-methyltransferase (adenine-specific)
MRWTLDVLQFNDSADASDSKEALISVKRGGVSAPHVRDLRSTVEREEAALGAFICIEPPTKPILKKAADAGFYTSPAGTQHPRLQMLTIEDLLNGKKLDLPAWHDVRTFKKAPRAKGAKRKDAELF